MERWWVTKMELLIGLIVAGLVIAIYIRYFVKGTAIILDRKAMLEEQTKIVSCTKCHTKMKRKQYEQQCPNCKALF